MRLNLWIRWLSSSHTYILWAASNVTKPGPFRRVDEFPAVPFELPTRSVPVVAPTVQRVTRLLATKQQYACIIKVTVNKDCCVFIWYKRVHSHCYRICPVVFSWNWQIFLFERFPGIAMRLRKNISSESLCKYYLWFWCLIFPSRPLKVA